jgi:hypothetical protein
METDKFKQVDGIDVTGVETAYTPLGHGAPYKKVVKLLLADGSEAYGCLWPECTFTAATPTTVATAHWGKIHGGTPDLRRTPFKDWTLEQILGRLIDSEADLKAVIDQRDKALARDGKHAETVANLRAEIRELKAQIAEYEKAMKILGRFIPHAQE